jgi:peptidoglycan hydrolase CwlO-like protein
MRNAVLALVALIAVLAVFGAPRSTAQNTTDARIQTLEKRIQQLESQVAEIQERIDRKDVSLSSLARPETRTWDTLGN